MKTLFSLIIIIYSCQVALAETDTPVFTITSDCILSIEVKKSDYIPGWVLNINLNSPAAKSLHVFSLENLKTPIRLIDGHGNNIIKNSIIIQTPLSTPFQVAALDSYEIAISAKKTILSSKGTCRSSKLK